MPESCLLAEEMEIVAIMAPDEAYLPREKDPNVKPVCHKEPISHCGERKSLLILLQFPTKAFFFPFGF